MAYIEVRCALCTRPCELVKGTVSDDAKLKCKLCGVYRACKLLEMCCLLNGGEGRNRTVDTTIFSRMLYQLSYLATEGMRSLQTNVNHSMRTRFRR